MKQIDVEVSATISMNYDPESEEECRKACDVHNDYHKWTKSEVETIFFKSITGQYPEEAVK